MTASTCSDVRSRHLVRRGVLSVLVVWLALLAPTGRLGAADLVPGAVAEYFRGLEGFPSAHPEAKPWLVRVDPLMFFSPTTLHFYGTKLYGHFAARWRGVMRIPLGGKWTFMAEALRWSGRLVIDGTQVFVGNGSNENREGPTGSIDLTAGDHPFEFEFCSGDANAGYWISMIQPDGLRRNLDPESIWHEPGAETRIAWDPKPFREYQDRGVPSRFVEMDRGPLAMHTILVGNETNTVPKAIAVHVDRTREAMAVFDIDLLRWAAAGSPAWLRFPLGRDGADTLWEYDASWGVQTRPGPGWAGPDGTFADPRTPTGYTVSRIGPLPKAWGSYHGAYLSGGRVVVAYSVGDAEVLDLPGFVQRDAIGASTRSLAITGGSHPVTTVVCDAFGAAAALEDGMAVLHRGDEATLVAAAGGGAALRIEGDHVLATLPAGSRACVIASWSGAAADLPAARALLAKLAPEDPRAFCKGGPARWPDAIETKGEIGGQDRAYVVDTITVPYDNPWKSYMRTSGHDFLPDGRAVVVTLDGDVWIVSGIDDKLEHVRWKRFATGLFQPLGVRVVKGEIYVCCRDGIEHPVDLDHDGEADYYESFNHDGQLDACTMDYSFDLETDSEGNFYYTTGHVESGNDPDEGVVVKISKDGQRHEVFATGLREPNGMGGGDGVPLLCSDNQGNWVPASRVNRLAAGGFYGFVPSAHRAAQPTATDPPICWIPMNQDNSSGGECYVPKGKWGPLGGTWLHTSYGASRCFSLFLDDCDGVPQGGVLPLPLHFQSGIMRARFNPYDGQVYLTGLGKSWQTNAAREGAFHRIRYTGKKHYHVVEAHIVHGGVQLRFAEPLDRALAVDPANWSSERWNYRWTEIYGSPEYSVANPDKEAHDPVAIAGVELDAAGTTCIVRIADLAPVNQLRLQCKIASADGEVIHDDLYLTVNRVPAK
jgi:hypothetical protein